MGSVEWAFDESDIERGIKNIPVQQGGRSFAKAQTTKGLNRKIWIWTKILSPNIRYFVAILRFVKIYALFGWLWPKKGLFWSKSVFLGHYDMVYITCHSELNLQICNYVEKRRIWCKNRKYVPDEKFYAHFCPCQKAANFCHPADQGLLKFPTRAF